MAADSFPIKRLLKFQVFLLILVFLFLTGETTFPRQVELDKQYQQATTLKKLEQIVLEIQKIIDEQNKILGPSKAAQECDADFNDDNYANVSDMLQLIESWGAYWNKSCDADLDNDNHASVSDLLLLIDAWGTCP